MDTLVKLFQMLMEITLQREVNIYPQEDRWLAQDEMIVFTQVEEYKKHPEKFCEKYSGESAGSGNRV